MPTPAISDEAIARTVAARQAHKTNVDTAKAIGVDEKTVRRHMALAAERGMLPTDPVMPGYYIARTTITPNGGKFIQQRKAHGDDYQVPDGHSVKGESALVDAEGRIIQKWVKTRNEATPVDWAAQLLEAFKDYAPNSYPLPAPEAPSAELLTLTPLADWHVGLMAWSGETGTNWDLKIAERVIGDGIEEVVARSPSSAEAIVLGGGDLLHSDNNENKTARSGNVLQVDGRYDKCLDVAERLVARTVDANLRRHGHVTVRILKGNHDEHSSVAIAHFLKGHYRNEPRVTVDTDASLFFWRRFGLVMLGATHGHEAKIKDMPSIMAHRRAEDWGSSRFRYVHGFHLHHSAKYATEGGGCISEVHQTPTPQDAWHFGSGFLSGRSLQSISYHRDYGEVSRVRVAMLDAANDNEAKEMAYGAA